MTTHEVWHYYYDARPRWRSALFPRYPRWVSPGWQYATFGLFACLCFDDWKGWGALLAWAGFLVYLYGMVRTWTDGER